MTKRPFILDDVLGVQRIACRVPMHLSPDGRWLAVSVQKQLGVTAKCYNGFTAAGVPDEALGSRVLLVQTTQFRAAVCDGAAGFNMLSQYALDAAWCEGEDQARLHGTPWNKRDAYIENSPLLYMDQVRTPLLLVAGSEDTANARQAEEAYNALRRLGQKVELRIYQGQGHGVTGWTEPNVRDVCDRVLSWFDEQLKLT